MIEKWRSRRSVERFIVSDSSLKRSDKAGGRTDDDDDDDDDDDTISGRRRPVAAPGRQDRQVIAGTRQVQNRSVVIQYMRWM